MNRLRLTWIMPAPGFSGGTKSNRLIAEAMQRRGHEVTIVYCNAPTPWPSMWRVRTFARRAWRAWSSRNQPRHHLEYAGVPMVAVDHKPIRAEDAPDADVVIGTWWETMEWIADWPAAKGLHAYFIRGYEVFGGDPQRVHATYRQPAQKLVISNYLRQLMADQFGDPTAALIPNGVDVTQFHAAPRSQQEVPTVGFIGHPDPIKGCRTAIEALHLVQEVLPQMRVVCFGSHALPHDLPLPRNFHFELRPAQDRIAELYRSADVWLLPSTTEGFGMPGLEAAACRCPLVVTRCGGPSDYVCEGVNGHIVSVGDVYAMADRLLKVLQAPAHQWRAMSEASAQIASRFDWDISAGLLEETLLAALHRAGRQPLLGDGPRQPVTPGALTLDASGLPAA